MKKKYIFIGGVILGISFLLFLLEKHTALSETLQLSIKEKPYIVQVARTALSREKGLSETQKIPHDGMIFIFPDSGIYSFWMKNMNYPIDILWIDKNFKIVEIRENLYPGTYPDVFTPYVESLYVLEVHAGFVDKNGIKVQDTIDLLN